MAEEPDQEKSVDTEFTAKSNMDIFECLATRRSIRKFTSSDIPMEMLGTILDAGRFAPSSGNIQNWRFVIVKNRETIAKIAEASMQQLWINQAPVVVVVCAETEKISQFYGVRGERLYLIQNCAAAIENMLLAAHAVGLASCWVGAFDENALRRILNIPEDIRPQAILPIGFPDEIVPSPMHYTLEAVCFFERYGSKIANLERVLQNPDVFGKIQGAVKTTIEAGKDIAEKAKGKIIKR
ncbi:nitroreductase family protein [Candidatus Woesearchaeota archaeon]|nr:nitroreductase family protein [Candidatus Woesearchaeota archaeon]